VIVIDEDLGRTGSGWAKRSGFARMTAEVALRHVGIVLGLEVSDMPPPPPPNKPVEVGIGPKG
jgi:hypothetical protein